MPGRRLRGADALRLHLTLAIGLAVCIGAFVIEVIRALDGNTLSWAYVFEWPIFAAFAIYMWWNLLHGQDGRRRRPTVPSVGPDGRARTEVPTAPATAPPAGPTPPPGATVDPAGAAGPDPDPDLAAWQAYLADMEAQEHHEAGAD